MMADVNTNNENVSAMTCYFKLFSSFSDECVY